MNGQKTNTTNSQPSKNEWRQVIQQLAVVQCVLQMPAELITDDARHGLASNIDSALDVVERAV